jgi:hypothetical protein
MKIRTGFVANSSSTSYVVFLPDWFYLKDEDIEHEFKSDEHETCRVDYSLDQFSKLMKDTFKELITEKYDDFFGFLGGSESGEEFVKRVRRNKKEKKYVELLRKGL